MLRILFKYSVYYFGKIPEDQGTGGKPINLCFIYTLSQFLAIFEVRRFYNAI